MSRAGRFVLSAVLALGIVGLTQVPASADVPEAYDGYTTVGVDTPTATFMEAYDPEEDPLLYVIVTPPAHGDLSACFGATCTYTPDPGYVGPDSFTWTANDGTADSNLATFSITVVEGGLRYFTTVTDTDVVAAGFGGMRGIGTGTITLSGVTGTVTAAYLYWNGPTSSNDTAAGASVTFAAPWP